MYINVTGASVKLAQKVKDKMAQNLEEILKRGKLCGKVLEKVCSSFCECV